MLRLSVMGLLPAGVVGLFAIGGAGAGRALAPGAAPPAGDAATTTSQAEQAEPAPATTVPPAADPSTSTTVETTTTTTTIPPIPPVSYVVPREVFPRHMELAPSMIAVGSTAVLRGQCQSVDPARPSAVITLFDLATRRIAEQTEAAFDAALRFDVTIGSGLSIGQYEIWVECSDYSGSVGTRLAPEGVLAYLEVVAAVPRPDIGNNIPETH